MRFAPRYLTPRVEADLAEKMVFLAGPRQVGKTTLALSLAGARRGYLNWDDPAHRERILRNELPEAPLWIFDEIHKWKKWRGFVKGRFDTRTRGQRILVTGSGRLDLYRHGGDSLQGRYHLLRLHPFSLAELGADGGMLESLLRLGGFPEPLLGGSESKARRWAREYRTRLIRDEVTSLERVHDLGTLELLSLRLPELVGSPLSVHALSEDLQVSHRTAESWIGILERLFAVYRLAPFGPPKVRALRHARKLYLVDWARVESDAARFENFVASHLLKWVQFLADGEGRDLDLHYFRDRDGHEVDFVVVEGRRPVLFVEAKSSDEPVDRGLAYLKSKYPAVDAWQLSRAGKRDFVDRTGIRVAPAARLLSTLV
jgi:hypothetical protein